MGCEDAPRAVAAPPGSTLPALIQINPWLYLNPPIPGHPMRAPIEYRGDYSPPYRIVYSHPHPNDHNSPHISRIVRQNLNTPRKGLRCGTRVPWSGIPGVHRAASDSMRGVARVSHGIPARLSAICAGTPYGSDPRLANFCPYGFILGPPKQPHYSTPGAVCQVESGPTKSRMCDLGFIDDLLDFLPEGI